MHLEKKAKGWIFISHSSQDYEDVKIVRNYLEENGFSALIFYLKSLEDPKKSKLTQQLIKWEIEARNIFVLCNSKESKKSPWVQEEIEYVKSFPEKIYVEIDMDKLKYEKSTQLSKLDKLMKNSTLFFSYSHKDKKIVDMTYKYLSQNGFQIWDMYKDISPSKNFQKSINNTIEKVSKEGVIVAFLSKNSLASTWFKKEIELALNLNIPIVPIIVDDIAIYKFFPLFSKRMVTIKLNIDNFEEKKIDLLLVLRRLKNSMQIILSFSTKDEQIVRKLQNHIPKKGIRATWIDHKRIGRGSDLPRVIKKEINNADVYFVFISQNSLDSDWLNKEIAFALKREEKLNYKFIVPVVLEEEALKRWKNKKLKDRKYIKYRDNFNNMANEIKNIIINRIIEKYNYRYIVKSKFVKNILAIVVSISIIVAFFTKPAEEKYIQNFQSNFPSCNTSQINFKDIWFISYATCPVNQKKKIFSFGIFNMIFSKEN